MRKKENIKILKELFKFKRWEKKAGIILIGMLIILIIIAGLTGQLDETWIKLKI